MNIILHKIILIPGKICGFILPYNLYIKFRPISRRLYTGWISRNIRRMGNNALICGDIHLVGGDKIIIGDNSCIDKHCSLTALGKNSKNIEIGNNVSIGPYAHITSVNHVKIEDNVDIGPRCLITDNSKKPTSETLNINPRLRPISSKGPVIIGAYTWIGENVCIMPGVNIGNNCVIGANAVVTKSFSERTIIAGNPARKIGEIVI